MNANKTVNVEQRNGYTIETRLNHRGKRYFAGVMEGKTVAKGKSAAAVGFKCAYFRTIRGN